MRRETFDTPGSLELTRSDSRAGTSTSTPSEGTESVVEISASPELEEEARIELHPKHDGHELSVVIEKRSGPSSSSFRDATISVRITTPPGADLDVSTALGGRRTRAVTSAPRRSTPPPATSDSRHVGGEAQVNSASGDVEPRRRSTDRSP